MEQTITITNVSHTAIFQFQGFHLMIKQSFRNITPGKTKTQELNVSILITHHCTLNAVVVGVVSGS